MLAKVKRADNTKSWGTRRGSGGRPLLWPRLVYFQAGKSSSGNTACGNTLKVPKAKCARILTAARFEIRNSGNNLHPSEDKCGTFHRVKSYPEDKRSVPDLSLLTLLDLKELSEEANFRTSQTQKVPVM